MSIGTYRDTRTSPLESRRSTRTENPSSLSSPKIVCAALKLDNGVIITSPRHFDKITHDLLKYINLNIEATTLLIQGFIDQHGTFYDRKEAYKIAVANNQICRTVPRNELGELYSENLY